MVGGVQGQGGLGHHGNPRFIWVLHDGGAARLLDMGQPARAVLVGTGQQNSQQAFAIGIACRGKQIVDGRPGMMHAVFLAQRQATVLLHR